MSKLRTYLRKGNRRHLESVIFSTLFVGILWCFWGSCHKEILDILHSIFKVGSTVIVALGVVGYNLRCKVIDYAIKMIAKECNYRALSKQAKACSERLTNIVVLSFVTSLISISVSIISVDAPCIIYLYVGTFILYIWCLVLYFHILFCFEELEEIIINRELKNRELKTLEKEKQKFKRGKELHPDN